VKAVSILYLMLVAAITTNLDVTAVYLKYVHTKEMSGRFSEQVGLLEVAARCRSLIRS
jgi:hypothetical protein